MSLTQEQRLRRRELRRRQIRRRRLTALAVLAVLVVIPVLVATLFGGGEDKLARAKREAVRKRLVAPPPKEAELPRGGRSILPEHRVVAFYGAPQNDRLGVLGVGRLSGVARKLERQARPYRRGHKPVLPAFELIATIANGYPGSDGKYRTRQTRAVVERHLLMARKARALLLLDIQPGREDFMREVRALRPWLEQPDVSVALDPEWSMQPGQIPGKVIGRTTAEKVNEVSAYLGRIVREKKLPDKLLVVHMFTNDMIIDKPKLRRRAGVDLLLNVDGFGTEAQKVAKYREFTRPPRPAPFGFKLFYKEDTGLMTPRRVLEMRPQPQLVVYE
jgi:hypothetical protein